MNVTIKYLTLFKKITGKSHETISVKENCTLEECIIDNVCKKYEQLHDYMIQRDSSKINEKLAFFINSEQVQPSDPIILKNDDVITILTPIQGG